MYDDLILFKKIYDLNMYLSSMVSKFPKTYRYSLGDRIEEKSLDMIDLIILISECRSGVDTKKYLKQLSVQKERIQIYVRMASDLNIIDKRKYIYVSGLLVEIGKIIGGWIKK